MRIMATIERYTVSLFAFEVSQLWWCTLRGLVGGQNLVFDVYYGT
jgi:hypothetical protein